MVEYGHCSQGMKTVVEMASNRGVTLVLKFENDVLKTMSHMQWGARLYTVLYPSNVGGQSSTPLMWGTSPLPL